MECFDFFSKLYMKFHLTLSSIGKRLKRRGDADKEDEKVAESFEESNMVDILHNADFGDGTMEIEELKKIIDLNPQAVGWTSPKGIEYIDIDNYVFDLLKVEKASIENSEQYFKNYIFLMSHIYLDIQEIKNRLSEYKTMHSSLQNLKGNQVEFKRRKILYFCDLDKEALNEISDFIANGIPNFLSDLNYDALNRECERGGLSDLFFRRRYKYAWHRSYYSIEYPYSAIVKITQYVREKYKFEDWMDQEDRLINLYKAEPAEFQKIMDDYVDKENVVNNILERVSNNYHLTKRKEIFETLKKLFEEGKYQSFITLGIIQVEGLFDDFCQIKYGESENQGTLVEKAKKTLENNEYNFLRMYPYFAFDVPLLRNEVAHKGMLNRDDAKRISYDLVLDLNTLSQMVKSESCDKFSCSYVIHEKLMEWNSSDDKDIDGLYDTLLYELIMFDKIASDHFWRVIYNLEDYKDEMDFYHLDDLPEGQIDMPGMVNEISNLIKDAGMWKAMLRLLDQFHTESTDWPEAVDFIRKMKNQYIRILDGDAKAACIEVSKRL